MVRIVKNELNVELKSVPKFIGIFEHFYDDSIYRVLSTYSVNLTYEYEMEETLNLITDYYSEYQ
jgi:hypothetical protein